MSSDDCIKNLFPTHLSMPCHIFTRTSGDISSAVGVRDAKDNEYFIKYNFGQSTDNLFRGEFEGLLAMHETGCGLKIPRPIAY